MNCASCGIPFECGMQEEKETCWCMNFPPVIAVPDEEAKCLCPECLQKLIGEKMK